MSTWHQRQNMPQLWHARLWTLVTDPPDGALCVERFKDPVEAQRQLERLVAAHVERQRTLYPTLPLDVLRRGAHCYILPPQR
jgi:hypothetical protein